MAHSVMLHFPLTTDDEICTRCLQKVVQKGKG